MESDTTARSKDSAPNMAHAGEAGINRIPFSEYASTRDPAPTGHAVSRRSRPLLAEGDEPRPTALDSYEFVLRGKNARRIDLWTLISRANGLRTLFETAQKFVAWYNQRTPEPETAKEPAVNHPRTMVHRILDDAYNLESTYGIVGFIENQTFEELYLEDWIQWYGWVSALEVPKKVEPYSTVFFDCVYSGLFWVRAAVAYRYRIGNSPEDQWYAYVAFSSSRVGFNTTTTLLSKDKNIPWNTIYQAMTTNSSLSSPSEAPYLMSSAMDLGFRARAGCSIAEAKYRSLTSSFLYMLYRWTMPESYKDEL